MSVRTVTQTSNALVTRNGDIVIEFGDAGTMEEYIDRYKKKHGTEPAAKRAEVVKTIVITTIK